MFKKQFFLVILLIFVSASFACAEEWEEDLDPVALSGTSSHLEATTRVLQPIYSRISDIQLSQSLVNAPHSAAILRETGISAGDEASGLNLWLNGVYIDFEDDTTGAAYDGNGTSFSVGADKSFGDGKLVAGLSMSYDMSETSNKTDAGRTDTDSFTFSPYLSYMFNNTYGVDFSFGWGQGDTDVQRYDWLLQKNSGSQDSDHSFYSIGVSGNHWLRNVSLSWRLGYYYSKTDSDAYTETNIATGVSSVVPESTNKVGQVAASLQVGYYLGTWMPYAKVVYENETTRTQSTATNDDDGFVWEAGASLFGSGPFSGGVSFSMKSGRGSYDSMNAMARLS